MHCGRPVVTITEPGMLSLLQISDSFFPTGAFAQSYGLETYVQEGLVKSKETLLEYLTTFLLKTTAAGDGLALILAYRAALEEDWNTILELDRILAAQKMARESREASTKTGSRMLRAVMELFPDKLLVRFSKTIRSGKACGHHAIAFGLVGKAIGIGEKELALAFTYTIAAGMVNNAVRLIPLGQLDGQIVLASLGKIILESVEISMGLTLDDLGASAPALEIRAIQHEHLYSRLFMS